MQKWSVMLVTFVLVLSANGILFITCSREDSDPKTEIVNKGTEYTTSQPFAALTRGENWTGKMIDDQGEGGTFTSLALDSQDRPHISYYEYSHQDLKYAHYDGTEWQIENADSGGVGMYTSLKLDSNERPHICYYDPANRNLKYASHDGTKWNNETVDSLGFVGLYCSMALDGNDRAHISYYDESAQDLKYAHFNGIGWDISVIDTYMNVGTFTALTLDSNDRPHISYVDQSEYKLQYAYFDGNDWWNRTVDPAVGTGMYSSIAVDSSGRAHISYYDATGEDLKYAFNNSGLWRLNRPDSEGDTGRYTSLVLDEDEEPHITYYDDTDGALRYIYRVDTVWIRETVDSDGSVGKCSSLALDSNGLGHASYSKGWNNGLKYAFRDLTPPVLDADNSPVFGTTGDYYLFNISASDNDVVKAVYVDWSHGLLGKNISLAESNGYWTGNARLGNTLEDLTYTAYVEDSAGHFHTGQQQEKSVRDNDPPSLDTDRSPSFGSTGDNFYLNFSTSDNIEVGEVIVNWSHGRLGGNHSLAKAGNYWAGHITSDNTSVENLTYTVYVVDTSDQVFKGAETNVAILDNDPPVFMGATGTENPSTGESFDLEVVLDDNIGVLTAQVRYTFDDLNYLDVTMEAMVGGTEGGWNAEIDIPEEAEYVNYSVSASDEAKNDLETDYNLLQVVDIVGPELVSDDTAGIPTTGEGFDFTATVADNIGVEAVELSYTFDNVDYFKEMLDNVIDNTWSGNVNISSSAAYINYSFRIFDGEGNLFETDLVTQVVRDDDNPAAKAGPDGEFDEESRVSFDGSGSTDNIGIESYTWTFTYDGSPVILDGMKTDYNFVITGSYNVTLTVEDGAGLESIDYVSIRIWDRTKPKAIATIDGMAIEEGVLYKVRKGASVKFDATESTDNTGIENYEWDISDEGKSLLGRSRDNIFESTGLYTVTLQVTDADGNSDTLTFEIEVTEKKEESSSMGTIIIISVVMVIIGGVVVLLLVLMKKKGGGGAESSIEPGKEGNREISPVKESLSQTPPPGDPAQIGAGGQPPQASPPIGSFPQTSTPADPQQGFGAGQAAQPPAFPPQNVSPETAEEQEYNEFMV